MTTASEEIAARYRRTWSKTDKFGRCILIGAIRPDKELAVLRMIESDDRVNQLTYLMVASIRKIDDVDYSPVRQLGELDSLLNKLDREGLDALQEAYAEMKKDLSPKDATEAKEEVKN